MVDRVRQKEGLSYGIGSALRISTCRRAARFSIQAIISAPQNPNKVDQAVKEQLTRVLKEGFSAEELARAKSGLLQENQNSRAQDGSLSAGWARLLDLNRTFSWSKQIQDKMSALTLDQVNDAFRKRIDPSRLSVVIVCDEAKAKAKANAVATTKP